MAGKPAVQVTGAKELRRALKRMGDDLNDLRAINLAAARDVADEAQHTVPRVSGALAGAITPKATKASGSVSAGGRRLPYAGVIHFGWPRHNIEPQPFLFDALDNRREAVADKYRERVDALVVRVGRETP